ncbi:hypothetical protein R1sor_013281 [Riccia sorocarpa]|uniref:Lipase-like C-terminal domain-containing protein n=1 Tax=Riccia sorocarpa TaxID=122646 RepID=A0ABD3H628_9MARC
MVLRWWLYSVVTVVELLVSSTVHVIYGLWIASSAITLTLAGFISDEHRRSSSRVMPFLSTALSPMSGTFVDVPGKEASRHMHSAATAFMDADVKTPIVMLHGIFGFGKGKLGQFSYWGGAELKDDRVLVPDLGALTSIHDRACALFYYLKGGTVYYGAARAKEFGHSPTGRTFQGHYPQWDEHHPVHFVGHSTGVQVARLLQQLLAEKKFPGHDTNENWVLSITSLSGALNGTTRVHMDGINDDGHTMRPVCLLQACRIAVLIYEWIDFGLLNRFYGFGFDHYNLSWRKAGLKGLISTLLGHSGPFTTTNWILPDLSIHSSIEFNKRVKTYPNTFYFSYASKITCKVFGFTVPPSLFRVHPLLLLRSIQMCLFRFTTPPYEGYRDEDWLDNDGALNLMSQLFPLSPAPHPNQPMESDELKVGQSFQPGIWYYRVIESDHINFIINKDRAGVHFDILETSNIFAACVLYSARSLLVGRSSVLLVETPCEGQLDAIMNCGGCPKELRSMRAL